VLYFAISLLVSAGTGGLGGFLSPGRTSLMLLGATGTYPIDHFGRYWTLISANYLHGGILHIIFNLMALKQIAPWASNEYGASRMFTIYTLGGVIGYVVSYLAGVPFTIGASAAVCSLIGALLYYGKSRGGDYGSSVYREVSGWVISLFIFGLIFPGINNWGHGGGIIGGIVVGALLGYNERRRENRFDHALALMCGLATIVVLGWALLGTFIYF
jgi:rhomboid protease GluP